MKKHIVVIGNLGAGKSTLTQLIAARTAYVPYWEDPEQRPFQQRFSMDLPRWALANQIDFLINRADQEVTIKQGSAVAIQDGGVDQDYFVFTRYLHVKGYLDDAGYDLCHTTYALLRKLIPLPDLYLLVTTPLETLVRRRALRARATDNMLVPRDDLVLFERFLRDWMATNRLPVIEVPSSDDDPDFGARLDPLLRDIANTIDGTESDV